MKKNKKYTRAEVVDFLNISYSMSVTPYFPLGNNVISDFKEGDGCWKKSITVAGYSFLTRSYTAWLNMRSRVSSGIAGTAPHYKGVTISQEWQSYEVFANWCSTQPAFYIKDFALDSDLLCNGVKRYSAESCCWLPCEINSFIKADRENRALPTGVYLNGKSFQAKASDRAIGTYKTPEEASIAYRAAKYIKAQELAAKYDGLISPEAHKALLLKFAPKQGADSSDGVVQAEAVA